MQDYGIHIYDQDDSWFTVELYESTPDNGLQMVDRVQEVNRDVADSFMLKVTEGYNLHRDTPVTYYLIREHYHHNKVITIKWTLV
ncbi:hypothetical protein [Alkalibacillus aidingensis]|uniref:hypothetical protein n=1 Tax=Alkalibacillus aidingensis TaxID=2747607 RepID=UPI001660F8DA|nr:hypothetical protein [Alkalibacillus aidingensis]